MQTPDTKHCPICGKGLPVSEFGICRARKDGRNLYCRTCINAKVTRSRRALKEYKTARKKYQTEIEAQILTEEAAHVMSFVKLSPVGRVKLAIARGSRTQAEIGRETKLGKDTIGDALAQLLLWTKEIETKSDGDRRYYFMREVPEQPQRKDCVLSLSCFGPVIKHERVA
jgi:hypothetical protein